MGKLGKPTLINWGSTNSVINKKFKSIFTKRNNAYFASLLMCLVLAGVFGAQKEYFLLNINKTTKLYSIKKDGRVTNNYVLTFQNTQDKAFTYDIKLEDNENFAIKRFKPFKLEAGKRIKKVFILEAKKRLFISDFKDTALKVKINAYAIEDKKTLQTKELSFVYPRNDLLNK